MSSAFCMHVGMPQSKGDAVDREQEGHGGHGDDDDEDSDAEECAIRVD